MAASASSKLRLFLLSLALLHIASPFATGAKLNVPRVLLPYFVSNAVNFTLEVSGGGCYNWKSTRPEVVRVHMVDVNAKRDCSVRAVITAVSRHPSHQTSLVLAQDEATGLILHCDAIVDEIHSLEIVRTTGELFLDDAPEVVATHAKDVNGDTFSSLDGLEFVWSLITDTSSEDRVEATAVLRFLPFSKSKYEAPLAIKMLEEHGAQGYMVLVEGKSTGSAKLTTRLKDPEFRHVRSEEITLVVIANLMLNPACEVHLLLGGTVHYKVEVIRQGKASEIAMPSEQFYLEIKDPRIVQLDSYASNVTALAYGMTTIVLRDRNIKAKEPLRQPSSVIHVVAATHLGLDVLPYNNWLLELGKMYRVIVNIFDEYNYAVHPSDNIRLQVAFAESTFDVIYTTPNGTYSSVIPLKVGTTQIEATLLPLQKSVFAEVGGERIKVKQAVEICEPVRIWPNMVILPWDPMMKPTHNLTLQATGGCGETYVWSTDQPDIVLVNQRGSLTSFGTGAANITAASSRNEHIAGTMRVLVVPVADMQIQPATLEVELDQIVQLPLAMFGKRDAAAKISALEDKIAFTDCRRLSLKVELSDPDKFEYLKDVDSPCGGGGGCATLHFKARNLGYSRVTVTYYNGEMELKAAATIASYKPLKVVSPFGPLVLALGSSHLVTFEGGPQPWVLKPDSHFALENVVNQSVATVSRMDSSECGNRHYHMFQVNCVEKGKATVELKVGNQVSNLLPKPAVSKATLSVSCSVPISIMLRPYVTRPNVTNATCVFDSGKIPVQCYTNLQVGVVMLDDEDHKFDNISSLNIAWDLSDRTLASLPHPDHLQATWREPRCLKVVSTLYQTILLHSKEGTLVVKVAVTGYHLNNHLIAMRPEVSALLELDLVDDAIVVPKTISIFNHPDNMVDLRITKGSGQFQLSPVNHLVAKVQYDQHSKTVHVYPLTEGSFTLTVKDLCLEAKSPATADIHVTQIKSIEVLMADKVELNKQIIATVRLVDPAGQCLSIRAAELTNLRAVKDSNIISVKANFSTDNSVCEAAFIVQGIALGHTTLTFQADVKKSGAVETVTTTLSSEVMQIQVFPPLRISPCNLTLITGAVFQVLSSGGPQPQSTIEYSVNNDSIASVSGSGIITALKLGTTHVSVQAIGRGGLTGERMVYSADSVNLFVVELTSIRIHSPINLMKSGTETLVYAVGGNDPENPFAFASSEPALLYEWSTSDKEVASIQPLYFHKDFHSAQSNFVMRLIAKRPGHLTLSLAVKPEKSGHNQIRNDARLTATLEIEVFDAINLIQPPLPTQTLYMTPNTELKLKTNRDMITTMSYRDVDIAKRVQNTCVTIVKPGFIQSGPKACQTAIIVTAHEKFGVNQSIAALVEVKPASYLVISSLTSIHTVDAPLKNFPVGGSVSLVVSFHTNVGDKFHAATVPLVYRPNRFDVLDVTPGSENNTYTIRALKAGQTVIRFSNRQNGRVETYINIVTEEALTPSKVAAVVGDIICFDSKVVSSEGNRGKWRADTGLVLHIDPHSGVAVATNPGSASIYYEVAKDLILQTNVVVAKIEAVTILQRNFNHLTNAWPEKVFDVPVLLKGGKSHGESNLLGSNCSVVLSAWKEISVPFHCAVSFTSSQNELAMAASAFRAQGTFHPASGRYVCRLTSKSSPETRRLLSTVRTEVEVAVSVLERGSQTAVRALGRVPFLPAFYVDADDVLLTTHDPFFRIPIFALDEVFDHLIVSVSNAKILEILPEEVDKKQQHVRVFPVHLRDDCWEAGEATYKVDFAWNFGGQKLSVSSLTVRVQFYQRTDEECPPSSSASKQVQKSSGWASKIFPHMSHYQGYLVTILTIFGTLICLLIGYWALFSQGLSAPTLNPDALASHQGGAARFSPLHGAVARGMSPSPMALPGRPLWTDNLPNYSARMSPLPASPQSPLPFNSNNRSPSRRPM